MRIGDLRYRVAIRQPLTLDDGQGGTFDSLAEQYTSRVLSEGGTTEYLTPINELESSLTLIATVWADVKKMSQERALKYGQILKGWPVDVAIRKRSDLDTSHYLVSDGEVIKIHSVQEIDRKWLKILGYVENN